MISPDVFEERKVRVEDVHMKNFPNHPILFNLYLDSERSSIVTGLTFKEAKATASELNKAIKRMVRNK